MFLMMRHDVASHGMWFPMCWGCCACWIILKVSSQLCTWAFLPQKVGRGGSCVQPCLVLRWRWEAVWPTSKPTQKLSRLHGLMLFLLTEVCCSKGVIIKSCKHRNHNALRGKEEIKQTQRHLRDRTIKMQNELHLVCKSIWMCIWFLSYSSL